MPIEEFQDDMAHRVYIEALRPLTPEQRLTKALETSDMVLKLFSQGLREQNPGPSEEKFKKLLREPLDQCHNRIFLVSRRSRRG